MPPTSTSTDSSNQKFHVPLTSGDISQIVRSFIIVAAGPPPPREYQGHQFDGIRLSLGSKSLLTIGRYCGKCMHPDHGDTTRYPNCHRVRFISPPLAPRTFKLLRQKVATYCRITNKAWGVAQNVGTINAPVAIDVDAASGSESVEPVDVDKIQVSHVVIDVDAFVTE